MEKMNSNNTAVADQRQQMSLRQRGFDLNKRQADQEYGLNELLNPLRVSSAQAQDSLLRQQVDRSTDAFSRLPQFTSQINELDPSDDQYDVKLSGILAQASDNPALFQSLQGAAVNAKAKRTAYLGTAAGAVVSGLQQDVMSGLVPYETYQKVKDLYKDAASSPSPDFTGVFAAVRDVNGQKATAARAALQQQLAQLGDYAPPLPPKLSMGIFDPAEIQDFGKQIADAQKQKSEAARQTAVAQTKNQGALDVQEARNEGRIQYAIKRYGDTPGGQSQEGQKQINYANSLIAQLKNPALSSDQRADLQGRLDGVNAAIEQQLNIPASEKSDSDTSTSGAEKLIDQAINTVQTQIGLGNKDLAPKTPWPSGLADPVESGTLWGNNVPDGMTPNEFRLQKLQERKAALQGQSGSPAVNTSSAASATPITLSQEEVDGGGSPFAAILNKPAPASLTPQTDAAVQASTAPTGMVTAPSPITGRATASVFTPPSAAIAKLKANPQLAGAFDAKYGEGMAAKYLK